MMVQSIENWADVRGKVTGISPAASGDFVAAQVQLESVEPVAGYANLFHDQQGGTIELNIPRQKAQQLTAGASIACRIRRAGPNTAFAHPDHVEVA